MYPWERFTSNGFVLGSTRHVDPTISKPSSWREVTRSSFPGFPAIPTSLRPRGGRAGAWGA